MVRGPSQEDQGLRFSVSDGELRLGELAQLGERLVCIQEVTGSSPVFSTSLDRVAGTVGYGWAGRGQRG